MATETCRHWRLEQDAEGLFWLDLDRAGTSVNSLSHEVLTELDGLLQNLGPAKGLVLRSAKPNGFIAGADTKEFGLLKDAAQAQAFIQQGQAVLDRLEALPFPTVALIHGFCLGGGLELALACTYRIASDAPETLLGAPEVKLGIHPGYGGTVRLTKLIGPLAALDLMLTGRNVKAKPARKLGLVDQVVPDRHLASAARALLKKAPAPHRPTWIQHLPEWPPLRPLVAARLRKGIAVHARRAHYPAPYALVDLWQHFEGDARARFQAEAASVATLITGDTAQNLVRVFHLQERMKGLAKKGAPAVKTVHVVGGGAMGGDIAIWCALQGLRVTVQDLDRERLGKVVTRGKELFQKTLKDARLVAAALDRLNPDPKGEGVACADLVIEAIFEDPEAKRTLFRALEPRLKPGALLATNTSSIPMEELAQALQQPGRLVGLHFFNPVSKMQLVEVVAGAQSEPQALEQATAFVGRIKRLPLPVKSAPGFLVNRILMPYLMEAMALASEGVPVAEIDEAALAFGMPMGPLLLGDTVGLEVCLSVARILGGHFGGTIPKELEALVKAGHFGRKSGRGFYDHKGKEPRPLPLALPPAPCADLQDRLMLRLVNEAVACLREGIVSDADLIDGGVIFGTGFAPFQGGPLAYARRAGALERLRSLEARYGSRFAPDAGWEGLG